MDAFASAKAPTPLDVSDFMYFKYFLHEYMCMFLKQEKTEIDDFERKKKNFGSKGKILQ